MAKKNTIDPAELDASAAAQKQQLEEDAVINHALLILGQRLRQPCEGDKLSSVEAVTDYLRIKLGGYQAHEVFGVLWLDPHCRLIEDEVMVEGTRQQAHMDVRKFMRSALHHNADGAVLYHNHPSGDPEPSDQDKKLTGQLAELLEQMDCTLYDHIIVGNGPGFPIASMMKLAKAEAEKEEREKSPVQRLMAALEDGDVETHMIHGSASLPEMVKLMLMLKSLKR